MRPPAMAATRAAWSSSFWPAYVSANSRERPLEAVARTEVGGHRDPVARAGVRPGEGPSAELRVDRHPVRPHALDGDRALPVAELAQ